MKAAWLPRLAIAGVLAGVLPSTPASAQTSLTIYNDGRVLVRRSVPANLSKGASSQRLALGSVAPFPDPTNRTGTSS